MSSQTHLDKRTARTRNALSNAFADLVMSKSYDSISVNEIIEKAEIGRSTFYQHYSSKDDILASSLQGPMSVIAKCTLPNTNTRKLEGVMQHFWDKRQFARLILVGSSRKRVIDVLNAENEQCLDKYYRSRNKRPRIPTSLAAAAISEAQITLVICWLTGKASCSLKDITQAVDATSKSITLALII